MHGKTLLTNALAGAAALVAHTRAAPGEEAPPQPQIALQNRSLSDLEQRVVADSVANPGRYELYRKQQSLKARYSSGQVDRNDPALRLLETQVRALPKIGRNEPCPCGSGRKYKQCHLPLTEPTR